MSSDDQLPDVPALRVLEPPPGGLAALRTRLAGEAAPRRRWWLAAVPMLALAVLALVIVRWPRTDEQPLPEAAPMTALADPTIGGSDVAFYWVASTPGGQNARTSEPRPEARQQMVATISIDDAPRVTVVAQP